MIDLAELLDEDGEPKGIVVPYKVPRHVKVDPDVLLALVEAVEAAHAYMLQGPYVIDSNERQKLRWKLEAFSFDGEAGS